MNAAHLPTRVKLCGLRRGADACDAMDAGADLVGIVMVDGSRRAVSVEAARRIVDALHAHAAASNRTPPDTVAVTALTDPDSLARLALETGVDVLQLVAADLDASTFDPHGRVASSILRTVSVRPDSNLDELAAQVRAWIARGAEVCIDSARDGRLGGTGLRVARDAALRVMAGARVGIAGGLDAAVVADVIRDLDPSLVDVAGGIEGADGLPDPVRMQQLVTAAMQACTPTRMEMIR